MDSAHPDSTDFRYDELAYFDENCAEYGLDATTTPVVERVSLRSSNGTVSALRWGAGEPELVLLHGGAQNAHTWDTVMLALGSPPALALDLPGHGHSQWRTDSRYDPHTNAATVIEVLRVSLEHPVVLVGMSLGGLTANRVAASAPELVSRLVVIDITPGVTRDKAREIHDFVAGPQRFATFAEILHRTVEYNPTRTVASLRRGILHNAHRNADGSWQWNYDRAQPDGDFTADREQLWSDIATTSAPYLLVRGGESPVTDEADVEELRRRRPDVVVEVVAGSGHSVQGDRPLELARMLRAEMSAASGCEPPP